MKLFGHRHDAIACRDAVEAVTAYLEGAMRGRDRARFEAHLAGCSNCSTYLEQIRETIALAGRLEADDLSPEARDALVGVFRAWAAESPGR